MIPICILAIESDHDRDFMTSLYLDRKGLIYREILGLAGSEAVDDLVQETMIRLIDKVELLETLDEKRLTAYVAETAKNTARNYLRKKTERIRPDRHGWRNGERTRFGDRADRDLAVRHGV